jgi:hypothetical protein
MSQLPMILELGVGSALRSGSYTKAACRAVRDALWRNSINLVEVFGAEKSSMRITAEIACQNPNKPDQPRAIIAHAAIIVSLDVTKKERAA